MNKIYDPFSELPIPITMKVRNRASIGKEYRKNASWGTDCYINENQGTTVQMRFPNFYSTQKKHYKTENALKESLLLKI
jgi:hypothetical protein